MDKLYSIGEAAKYLGVSVSTLRRWENSGKLLPERTKGQQRRYPISLLGYLTAIVNLPKHVYSYPLWISYTV